MITTRAFTLIELLVAITIVAILAGLLMAAVPLVRLRAKCTVTTHRMQEFERAIISLGGQTPAEGLQRSLKLGGVLRFDTLQRVMRSIRPTTGYANYDVYPPVPSFADVHWSNAATTRQNWVIMAFEDRGASWWQWRKGSGSFQEISEVMPPGGTVTSRTWWTTVWPSLWPRSDWDQDTPGTTPPMLRFPWGQPGLRRDGTVVDAGSPATIMVNGVPNAWVAGADLPDAGGATTISWTASEGNRVLGSTALSNPFAGDIMPVYAQRSDGSDAFTSLSSIANQPEPFDVGLMSPLRTIDALVASGICIDAEHARTDRSPSRAWNDAWGHPLIVSYALFQPERFITDDPEAWTGHPGRLDHRYFARDRLLRRSQAVYGFSRAVYLSIGALGTDPGPELRARWNNGTWNASDDNLILRDAWRRIRTVTNAVDWNELGHETLPWTGIRRHKREGATALVSAPVEIH